MIELSDFKDHLKSISEEEWNSLFRLLPIIKKTENFGNLIEPKQLDDGSLSFPYWESAQIVDETLEIIYTLELLPVFDWMKWKRGADIMQNESFDFKTLDLITLFKLLTCIFRMDRFSDGYLISSFQNRKIEKIIECIQNKIYEIESFKSENLLTKIIRKLKKLK